jgi:hypothetical protein
MLPEVERWSPEQELRLLEELAEAEAQAFELEEELPLAVGAKEAEPTWVAFWQLPPNGIRSKYRNGQRAARRR